MVLVVCTVLHCSRNTLAYFCFMNKKIAYDVGLFKKNHKKPPNKTPIKSWNSLCLFSRLSLCGNPGVTEESLFPFAIKVFQVLTFIFASLCNSLFCSLSAANFCFSPFLKSSGCYKRHRIKPECAVQGAGRGDKEHLWCWSNATVLGEEILLENGQLL